MSLAIYAAPFDSNNNDNNNNELYSRNSQDTPINRKKVMNNKTQKRLPQPEQNYNSEKVSSVLQTLHSNPSSDTNDLGDFKFIPPPSSVGVENTKIKEGMANQNNKYNYETNDMDDVDIQSLNDNYMNDKAVEKYYKNLMPGYNHNHNQKMYNKTEYNKPYYPLNTLNQGEESENYKLLSDKLNYMINLLEEQQDERTNNVTEEVVLYSFLGIFIIFVVDSFARVGKYVR